MDRKPAEAFRRLTGWVFDLIPAPGGMTVWFRAESGETFLLGAAVRKAERAFGPGSKIRYLLADGKGRAMGFLDGTETPDFARYEEMLREAEEELLGPVRGDCPANRAGGSSNPRGR